MAKHHSYGRVIGIAKVGYGYIGLHEVGAENFSLLRIYISRPLAAHLCYSVIHCSMDCVMNYIMQS